MTSTQAVAASNTAFHALLEQAQAHWNERVHEAVLTTIDGVRINFAWLTAENARGTVLIANGRAETYLKYKDLAYQLNTHGYSVLLYDHRGQGLSGRLLQDPLKGYVETFADYISDLKLLLESEIATKQPDHKIILLAHSMGALIASLYAIQYPDDIDALLLSSPMFGLPAGPLGKWLAETIDVTDSLLRKISPHEPVYIPGINRNRPTPFAKNELTHSRARYEHVQAMLRETPEIALGDPSTHWVRESYRAFSTLYARTQSIQLPVLLLQAGNDRVVSNRAQDRFCRTIATRCQGGAPIVIKNARHELLNEASEYRDQAVREILTFLRQMTD